MSRLPFLCIAVPIFLFVLVQGCAPGRTVHAEPDGQLPSVRGSYAPGVISPAWFPLYERLRGDGLDGPDLPALFVAMGEPSPDPMGRKIRELYTSAFTPKPKPKPARPGVRPVKPRPAVYPGVITTENARKCQEFIAANKDAFDHGENAFGVPREIAVSLLFVETRLGTFLGNGQAFYTLASMASSREPGQIPDVVEKLPGADARLEWIRSRMEQRSDWAYKELVALLRNVRSSGSDPLSMPGSIYGAVGLCQFMPSNIEHYGADGDGDGVINLFSVPDAVARLSNYLKQHGWKPGLSRERQQKVLKSYNRVNIYANTILGLAEAQGYAAE